MNSNIRIAATQFFRRDMVCLRSVIADTLHEGDTDDDDDDDNDNNNNNNNNNNKPIVARFVGIGVPFLTGYSKGHTK